MRLPFVNKFTCTPKQLPFVIEKLRRKKMLPIIDYVNEDGKNYKNNYQTLVNSIETFPMTYFALKLSSLNLRDKNMCRNRIIDNTIELGNLIEENSSKLLIDAEEMEINDEINDISDIMMEIFNRDDVIVYKTYQMYRKDGFKILQNDLDKDRDYFIGCKLVRGAYYNQDVITDKLFWDIKYTHKSYNEAIEYFIENRKNKDQLMCATHNYESTDLIKNYIHSGNKNITIAHLMGLSDYLGKDLVEEGINILKYIPYGEYNETLPYLGRRLYENYPVLGHLI